MAYNGEYRLRLFTLQRLTQTTHCNVLKIKEFCIVFHSCFYWCRIRHREKRLDISSTTDFLCLSTTYYSINHSKTFRRLSCKAVFGSDTRRCFWFLLHTRKRMMQFVFRVTAFRVSQSNNCVIEKHPLRAGGIGTQTLMQILKTSDGMSNRQRDDWCSLTTSIAISLAPTAFLAMCVHSSRGVWLLAIAAAI